MKLSSMYSAEVKLLVKACKRLAANMFVTGTGGNLAWRLQENLVLITPTQMNKGDIEKEDLVFIDMNGETIEGKKKPTGEKPMYLKFFRDRPDIKTVIHCHPPCVCAIAITKNKDILMRPFFPETTIEVGPVPVVPYAQPLTTDLAEKFKPFLQKYNTFIMENHGMVSMSTGDIYNTLLNIEVLEGTADSILKALAAGLELQELSHEAVRDLSNVMSTRGLPLFGAPGVNKTLESLYF